MSLSPIPSRMLHDRAVFHVVTGMDMYQNKTYEDYEVSNVHIQADHDVIKGPQDTEVQLKGILYVDGRRSQPQLDYTALENQSLDMGDTMRVTVYDASGNKTGEYAILTVDGLPDVPAMRTHHWELTLV